MKLDALAPTLQSFLAFDFGTRRIGVASGTRLLGAAEPRATVKGGDFAAIATLIQTWQPDALVVGVPRHPDGAPHEMTAKAQNFGRRLAGRYHLPVFEVDERYTSVESDRDSSKNTPSPISSAAITRR